MVRYCRGSVAVTVHLGLRRVAELPDGRFVWRAELNLPRQTPDVVVMRIATRNLVPFTTTKSEYGRLAFAWSFWAQPCGGCMRSVGRPHDTTCSIDPWHAPLLAANFTSDARLISGSFQG